MQQLVAHAFGRLIDGEHHSEGDGELYWRRAIGERRHGGAFALAILTSERAEIKDPKVRLLADRIIDSQVREIREMKRLIAELEAHPVPDGAPVLPSYRDRGLPPPPPETDAEANVNTLQPPE